MSRNVLSIAIIFLFTCYLIVTFIVGVLFVPYYAIWGPEKEIERALYAPIWEIMNDRQFINGYKVIYQINGEKLIFELLVISLITFILYFIIREIKKLKSQ